MHVFLVVIDYLLHTFTHTDTRAHVGTHTHTHTRESTLRVHNRANRTCASVRVGTAGI